MTTKQTIGRSLFVALALIALPTSAEAKGKSAAACPAVPLGPKVEESEYLTKQQVYCLAAMIRLKGYDCSQVHNALPFAFSEGYTVRCNGGRYSYQVVNKGGRFLVSVE